MAFADLARGSTMKAPENSIENNVKLIAIVGAISFATLIGALIVVQQSLVTSQAMLSETVVPVQQQLGKIAAEQGCMFLRQTEIAAADEATLQSLVETDNGGHEHREDSIRDDVAKFQNLVLATGLNKMSGFPSAAVNALNEQTESFLKADDTLFHASASYQKSRTEFLSSVDSIEKDMRSLMEASGGIAGVLRLNFVLQLRRLSGEMKEDQVESASLRPVIYGDLRLQKDTIFQLDAAVLRLGVLAGRVGMAINDDTINSLSANELILNREQILHVLTKLEKLVTDENLALRVSNLRASATELARRVGDESLPTSLASLRRRMLREEQIVRLSQLDSARAAERLDRNTSELRTFLQEVANQAQFSASWTIRRSQQVVLTISIVTLVLTVIAAFRVRSSVMALRLQNQRLSNLSDELTQANQGLERTVADRTASLQTVLDSTGDGLLSVDLTGVLLPERSKVVSTWFGDSQPGSTLWSYVASDAETSESLALAIEQMSENILPFEVSADQAPKTIRRDDRTYAIEYREIRELGKLSRILILLRDITSEIVAKQAESEMRELHTVIGNLLKDRNGFDQTVEDCASLISEISQAMGSAVVKQNLHTLKGNCATVGFQRVADYVHNLEGLLIAELREPRKDEIEDLERCWQSSLSTISDYIGSSRNSKIELSLSELEALEEMLDRHVSYEEIGQVIKSWRDEPTAIQLRRLAEHAKHLANRLGKDVSVCVTDNRLRIPAERLRRFWSTMIHVVRNAMDHGIEEPKTREQLGKLRVAKLALSTRSVNGCYEIEVSDDGCGINWQRVRSIAELRRLPSATDRDLMNALFSDGISTREIASDVSGRGMGLGAVRNECEKAGGEIHIESRPGVGTSFLFRFAASHIGRSYPAIHLPTKLSDVVTYG